MGVDFLAAWENGCKMDVAFIPPQIMDAQLDVAFVPPHAKMSCFVWLWDDICPLIAE